MKNIRVAIAREISRVNVLETIAMEVKRVTSRKDSRNSLRKGP